ncbi:MAG TPA: osmotically inducible protein C, partial [Pseudomonadaceae bacterium]|nr:osmotically inducible protein C [Pseudomonadaceae bacterium]
MARGKAEVTLGERKFTIKEQFLDDLEAHSEQDISRLKKALLVCHSPLDTTVSLNEAEKIYRAARHPKSFVSLDTADHLLSRKEDSSYVAEVIAAWAGRYVDLKPAEDARRSAKPGEVVVEE